MFEVFRAGRTVEMVSRLAPRLSSHESTILSGSSRSPQCSSLRCAFPCENQVYDNMDEFLA